MRLFRAWTTLVWLSFRRLWWSVTTFMVMFPLLGAGLFLVRWRGRLPEADYEAFNLFSERFVVILFTLFLLPICSLAYATTSIGGDREERTLLFLLIRPVPKWLILLAKLCATLPLVLGLVIGSFYVYCQLAGEIGRRAWELYLPAIFLMTVAYVCLFHLFSVTFRHATIVALIYALFMEGFLGNVPGIINRVAVSFYGRSIMYRQPAEFGLVEPPMFSSVSIDTAMWSLLWISVGSVLLAMWIMQRREFRDLS